MSSGSASSKSPYPTNDVLELAEFLGVILVPKLNDCVRQAMAFEAGLWRADALHIVKELREDIRCRLREPYLPAHPTNLEVPVLPHPSEKSSNSSCRSLPLTTFRKSTSLEQQLAANIFAAKYAERGAREPLGQLRKEKNVIHSERSLRRLKIVPSHDAPNMVACDSLIPSDPSGHFPHPVAAEGYNGTTSSQEASFVAPISSNSAALVSPISQLERLENSPASLEPILTENSAGSELSIGAGSECEPTWSRMRSNESMISTRSGSWWHGEAKKFYDHRSILASEARGKAGSLRVTVFRLLGIIPWSLQRLLLSRFYQFAVLCCLMGSTINVLAEPFGLSSFDKGDKIFAAYVDDVLAIGSVLSFVAALWKNQALHDASWLIESYLFRAGRLEEAKKKSRLDIVALLLVWSLCVGSRFYANALNLNSIDFGFAFNVLILLAVCFYALQPCCCLRDMTDYFCHYMQEDVNFEMALQEFFLLHCTMRTVCNSLQFCFAALLLTATGTFLFCSASLYFGELTVRWGMMAFVPGVLCELCLLHLSVRAGLVSDLCARVPMLVNSVNANLEMKRMYVVDYIVHCQAGFYVFEVRVTTGALLKLSYVAFVAWCGVLTRGML